MRIANLMKKFFVLSIVSQIPSISDTKYPEEKNLIPSSCVQKLRLKQVEECQFYYAPLRRIIGHDPKTVMNFPMLSDSIYNMNDFSAIIFRRFYTLQTVFLYALYSKPKQIKQHRVYIIMCVLDLYAERSYHLGYIKHYAMSP